MNENQKVSTRTVVIPDDLEAVKKLWFDYLVWGNDKMQELYGVHPHNPEETVEQDIQQIGKFQPPYGQLILAIYEGEVCGLGSLKRINSDIGEIKRMFVHPASRRVGAGRAILNQLLVEAGKIGYKKVRLDSPKFMEAAHALYRRFGFRDIDAYPEMEISAAFKNCLLFMELNLIDYNK
ncbi:GCN5-related N-acetyltransferase [Fibrella aestuarina BUZ 2]|uniref:GCN5-related N-acetyltransferase n=1 Tax=Fibrella aestuarina BUZ 2 TaxID=1166018 RepID=I0KDK9_9BACT|nr:GNAT family N-acetyltransferase [Fibrella aestuarina]CCH02212.1 GCN5-related N-acetyltransferase [Fibrella aestuarina BUZ 2]